MKEQIKGFNKAYEKAKRLGFENYFCIPQTTWKEAKESFDKGRILKEEFYIIILQENVRIVLNLKTKKLPYCKSCKNLFSSQEFVSGFKYCEYCDRNPNKDELKELVEEKLRKIKNENNRDK